MDIKWLEDFVSLADTRNFSRSAQLRHVTQPAFSRRIQALEAWAGSDLVDRASYPPRLTAAGETLYGQALELLQSLQSTRAMLRGHSTASRAAIDFAVSHSLAFTFFPRWLTSLRKEIGPVRTKLFALNAHDATMSLVEGNCDILIAFFHPAYPFQLDRLRYDTVVLGEEVVSPWSRPRSDGRALYELPGRAGQPLPYLGYASGVYLGLLVDLLVRQSPVPLHLDRVYEMDMAEGLKAMALEGHGIAFLPEGTVRNEVASGRLVSAVPAGMTGVSIVAQILAVREKPGPTADTRSAAAQLWAYLSR
ncbi:LysR family transcriptional regulator [Variovorax terrae]|uniref:LysR substrate-binding domain-containing protein n=1 Tax=Variovorax terrae TaxID=2923278 RepID=A0A9X2AMM5_9BURK|nr:LysR family transcriptional regulator [Variovorax terrae]MCJ0763893.1 LysR substrate-binding domain-containing protein [Variovorax terrae]